MIRLKRTALSLSIRTCTLLLVAYFPRQTLSRKKENWSEEILQDQLKTSARKLSGSCSLSVQFEKNWRRHVETGGFVHHGKILKRARRTDASGVSWSYQMRCKNVRVVAVNAVRGCRVKRANSTLTSTPTSPVQVVAVNTLNFLSSSITSFD